MEKQIAITLNFRRSDFEEIYYRNNQGDYIKDPSIKSLLRYFVLSLILFSCFLFYNSNINKLGYLIIPFILVMICGFTYFERFSVLWKWRKAIENYLNEQETYSSHKLILSENCFSILEDTKETIEKWDNIKRAKILEDYIIITGDENFFIPAKSMTQEEFSLLKDIVSEKIK